MTAEAASAGGTAVTKEQREVISNWMMVAGALLLFVSLFLTWSHQFSPAFLAQFGRSDLLRGVPRDPTAWQVYSIADVLLALLAGAILAGALFGNRVVRTVATGGVAAAFGFTLHALSAPPSNGGHIFNPALSVPNYFPNAPTAGVGETVALLALVLAGAGLALSFTAD